MVKSQRPRENHRHKKKRRERTLSQSTITSLALGAVWGSAREVRPQSQLYICEEGKIGESPQTCCTFSLGLTVGSSGGERNLMQVTSLLCIQVLSHLSQAQVGEVTGSTSMVTLFALALPTSSGPEGGGTKTRGGLPQGRSWVLG